MQITAWSLIRLGIHQWSVINCSLIARVPSFIASLLRGKLAQDNQDIFLKCRNKCKTVIVVLLYKTAGVQYYLGNRVALTSVNVVVSR